MKTEQENQLYEKLSAEINVATWKGLIPDMLSRSLFLVSHDLDLADVGVQVALDHTPKVKEWLDTGKLTRPTKEQIDEWETTGSLFRFIIVQPFVFFQEYEAAAY